MELLAPAGNKENFIRGLAAGADAIYLGGKHFGARAKAANFTIEELEEVIPLAHLLGVPVYVTVNTLISNDELGPLTQYIKDLLAVGVDAFIVQDLGTLATIREIDSLIPIHGSTQMSATNLSMVQRLYELGCSRVVLGRELSLDEIRRICQGTDVEIEVFVHGALCISYSGQCVMSSLLGGRSGNRGECAQPCRLPYELVNKRGLTVSDPNAPYIMSPKDLNYSAYCKELQDMGVASLKIEGRMKQADYVQEVVSSYRCLMDDVGPKEEAFLKLKDTFNRGFTTHYLRDTVSRSMMTLQGTTGGKKEETNKEELRSLQKIGIHAFLDGKEGQSVTLTVMDDKGRAVTVTNEYVLAQARKSPTSHEQISKQLERLGNTVFYLESVTYPEGPYMWPASVLNALRRDAVTAMNTFLLDEYDSYYKEHCMALEEKRKRVQLISEEKRGSQGILKGYAAREGLVKNAFMHGEGPHIAVRVDSKEGLLGAIEGGADCLFFELAPLQRKPLSLEEIYTCRQLAKDKEIPFVITAPRIIKPKEEEDTKRCLQEVLQWEPEGASIHFLGALSWLQEVAFSGPIWGDTSLNCTNYKSAQLYHELGLSGLILSEELSLKDMNYIGSHCKDMSFGALIHGPLELMISEYCVINSMMTSVPKSKCPKPCMSDEYFLKDRKGVLFPIKTDPYCRMHIQNGHTLDMRPYVTNLMGTALQLWLIEGRQQDREVVRNWIGDYKQLRDGQSFSDSKEEEHVTRGHFFKGIF